MQMSELDTAIKALRESGKAMLAAADALTDFFSSKHEENPQETTTEVKPPAPKTGKPAKPEKAVTLEQVRAVLAEKSRSGHSAEVKELLEKHGAARLSEIDPAEYPALLKDAEVI